MERKAPSSTIDPQHQLPPAPDDQRRPWWGRWWVWLALLVIAIVIVLAFQKTTQKTPRRPIELALRRAKGLAP